MKYLITVKLPRNPKHDPASKKTGPCPVFTGSTCTDATGEHHTGMVEYPDNVGIATVTAVWSMTHHVTRVETV